MLQFAYSKTKEKERLLNIYEEYQWFIDQNFPIVLPKFYHKIYLPNNKKAFNKKLTSELNKIYDKSDYIYKQEKIKKNWQKIERQFLGVLKDLNFKVKDKYICYLSLYGPEGQFKYPNIINLRVKTIKDISETNDTIAHELIHLLILNKAKNLKLNYKQIEGIVDLFFKKTELCKLFPRYKLQKGVIYNENLLKNFI